MACSGDVARIFDVAVRVADTGGEITNRSLTTAETLAGRGDLSAGDVANITTLYNRGCSIIDAVTIEGITLTPTPSGTVDVSATVSVPGTRRIQSTVEVASGEGSQRLVAEGSGNQTIQTQHPATPGENEVCVDVVSVDPVGSELLG